MALPPEIYLNLNFYQIILNTDKPMICIKKFLYENPKNNYLSREIVYEPNNVIQPINLF